MMTVRQIFDDLLGTLGVDNPDTSSNSLRVAVLGYISAGLQLMQLAGEDFYCREDIDLSLASGTGSYDLDSDVQTVLAPLRLSGGQPLRALTSRSQLQDFGPLFLGQTSRTVAGGTPIAYFVESSKSDALTVAKATGNIVVAGAGSTVVNGTYTLVGIIDGKPFYFKNTASNIYLRWGTTRWELLGGIGIGANYYSASTSATPDLAASWTAGVAAAPVPTVTAEMSTPTGEDDPAKITLHLLPVPSATGTLKVPVIKEPPTYTADDLCGTSPTPPVPHQYHESILLPLCRMNVTTHPSFARHKDKLTQIEADYLRALTLLGLSDPRKPKPEDSNSNRLQSLAEKPAQQ